MDQDTILGCILIVAGLSAVVYLTLWSRRTINRIADKGERSGREIVKDLQDGG